MLFVVTYTGPFGFIKPWTAVRDAGSPGTKTYSQQFLTPSIIEGIRQKLEVSAILRHKISHAGISMQLERIQAPAWKESKDKKNITYKREFSIYNRGVMINPVLRLAFQTKEDAQKASEQHLCLCRNEDIILPLDDIEELSLAEFEAIEGFELKFTDSSNPKAFLVGYNRFKLNENGIPEAMFGEIIITGNPVRNTSYV
jgi:hypothetical protein